MALDAVQRHVVCVQFLQQLVVNFQLERCLGIIIHSLFLKFRSLFAKRYLEHDTVSINAPSNMPYYLVNVVHVLVTGAKHLICHKHQRRLNRAEVVVFFIIFQHLYGITVLCGQKVVFDQF